MGEGSVRVHVTLVHGTFARGAEWTKPQSAFCRSVYEQLGHSATVSSFEWSGRNSHSARLLAAHQLSEHLDSVEVRYPAAEQVLICHSHGGNVALYACRKLEEGRERQLYIVTLATPFIAVRRRQSGSLLAWLGWGGLLFLFWAILALSTLGLRDGSMGWLDFVPMAALATVAPLIAIYATRTYARSYAKHLYEQLAWPMDGRIHLLTLAYHWDEARGYLATLVRVSTGTSRLVWKLIGALLAAFTAYAVLTVYAANYNEPLYRSAFIHPQGRLFPWVIEVLLSSFTILALLLLVAAWAYLINLVRGNPYGFGWERPSSTTYLDIDAVDRPDGLPTLSEQHSRLPFGSLTGRVKRLAHNSMYDDPHVVEIIATWIKTRLQLK